MDKSQVYIRMCEQAGEIQCLWAQDYGDFFVGKNGQIRCWITERYATVRVKRGFGVECGGDVIHLTRMIWLPRQSQLIEMAQEPGKRYETVTLEFFNWAKKPYGPNPSEKRNPGKIFKSLEQIWLAFVMFKNHGKWWNDEQWLSNAGSPLQSS